MKLTTLALVGLLATVRCPSMPEEPPPPDENEEECWGMTTSLPTCEPGTEQIDPRRDPRLGFNKRYYEGPQSAVVASVSGESMVLEGPWNMPYTFTWFEPLDGLFQEGDEVVLSGGDWDRVEGPRGTVAHARVGGFSMRSPTPVVADGAEMGFFAECATGSTTFVYGVVATLGEETVTVSQGERGSIAGWEFLHHGAVSAPGFVEDCVVAEGMFYGAISAWTTAP
ncbi:MAG TPA: hypothetical protein VN033_02565 [Vulgatibacter sp.]|nr:hypothetical protein [Vulgatibacter sp.]